VLSGAGGSAADGLARPGAWAPCSAACPASGGAGEAGRRGTSGACERRASGVRVAIAAAGPASATRLLQMVLPMLRAGPPLTSSLLEALYTTSTMRVFLATACSPGAAMSESPRRTRGSGRICAACGLARGAGRRGEGAGGRGMPTSEPQEKLPASRRRALNLVLPPRTRTFLTATLLDSLVLADWRPSSYLRAGASLSAAAAGRAR
jgi:hypothetical protein